MSMFRDARKFQVRVSGNVGHEPVKGPSFYANRDIQRFRNGGPVRTVLLFSRGCHQKCKYIFLTSQTLKTL